MHRNRRLYSITWSARASSLSGACHVKRWSHLELGRAADGQATTCVKCGEALIAPDWSEFVSERLVLNLWTCTKCGDRFETKAYMPVDAEPKMSQEDWEDMFPPLLVA
jgi:ribosomal protein L37AE/L43A